MISIGTDFSGIGSPEQALIKLGVKHDSKFACDYDKYAKQSYLANYDTDIFYDDITTRNHKETSYVDLYVAGFPCQAFSMAGKRKGFEDTRGTLFFDLLQYLKEQRPKYFVLENVKGLLSHDKGRTFGTILDCLAKTVNSQYFLTPPQNLGYHIYYKVLNTKDYGIPQNRERIFIVGFREDKHKFKFPKKIPLKLKLKDMLQDNTDSKYYLSDKMIKGIQKSNFRERQPMDINGVCKTLKIGGDTPCFKVHSLYPRSSKTGKGGSGPLSKEDGTTYCIDTGNSQAIEYDKRIRRLTPKECFRLQGFPDSFVDKCREVGISDTQLYKQAGNSMTVDVMAYLIKEILVNEKESMEVYS
jgi:DNA (cytosine-5)-methyltransferase 1